VLVNNAAHQMSFKAIEEISDEEWEKTLSTNIFAIQARAHLCHARERRHARCGACRESL
jgi:NAD(P)-dependent dehydrogenase (short-subunit alcohol dehydrogenase family)